MACQAGYGAPVVKRPGDGPGTTEAARPEAATIDISFTRGSTLFIEPEADLQPGEPLHLAGRSDAVLRDLDTGPARSDGETHVGRILDKLELRDRVQAVVPAYDVGLVRPA